MKGKLKALLAFFLVVGLYFPTSVLASANDIDLTSIDPKMVEKDPYYVIGRSVILKDGSRYHVIQDSLKDDPYMTLLSDYNLTAAGTQDAACRAKECRPMAFDTTGKVNYQESSTGQFISTTYFNAVKNGLQTNGGNPEGLQVTLPDKNMLLNALGSPTGDLRGYSNLDQAANASWLLTTNYWTKTNSSNTTMYYIDGNEHKLTGAVATTSDIIGVRPVLVTLKSNDVSYSPPTASLQITGEEGNYKAIAKDQNGNILTVPITWSVDSEAKMNGVSINGGKLEFQRSYEKPVTVRAKVQNQEVMAEVTYKQDDTNSSFFPTKFLILVAFLALIGGSGYYFYKKHK